MFLQWKMKNVRNIRYQPDRTLPSGFRNSWPDVDNDWHGHSWVHRPILPTGTRVCNKRDCGFRMIGCQAALQIIFGGKHDILSFLELSSRKYGTKISFLSLPLPGSHSWKSHVSSRNIKGIQGNALNADGSTFSNRRTIGDVNLQCHI